MSNVRWTEPRLYELRSGTKMLCDLLHDEAEAASKAVEYAGEGQPDVRIRCVHWPPDEASIEVFPGDTDEALLGRVRETNERLREREASD